MMDERFDPNLWCIKFLHKFHWQEKNEESLKNKAECLFSTRTKQDQGQSPGGFAVWLRYWGSNVGLWLHPWLSLLSKFLWKVNFMNDTGGLLFLPVSSGRSWTKPLLVGKKILISLIVRFCPRRGTVVRLAGWRTGVYSTIFRRTLDLIPHVSQWMNYGQFHVIDSFIFSYFKINIYYECLDCYALKLISDFHVQVASININLVCSKVSFIDLL